MTDSAPWVLGIGASHNGAVCLMHGDEIVVAVQEERLTRQKRARVRGAAPALAITYCLEYAGLHPRQLAAVVLCAQGHNSSLRDDAYLNPALQLMRNEVPLVTMAHHLGHAASAFGGCGWPESAVLVVDGIGSPYLDLGEDERAAIRRRMVDGWESVSIYHADGTALRPVEKQLVARGGMLRLPGTGEPLVDDAGVLRTPDQFIAGSGGTVPFTGMPCFGTLGGMYGAAAYQIFGDTLDGSGKVMGLAPYGYPAIPVAEFLDIADGELTFRDEVPRRFGSDERWPKRETEYADLAASAQAALEEAMLALARRARRLTGSRRLCLAGGVALNSVANDRIIREAGFDEVFIVPAAEDSGTALGAAYWGVWQVTGENRCRRLTRDAVGREYHDDDVAAAIGATPGIQVVRLDDPVDAAARLLAEGRILGWFHGRSELGPRALGQRSILCDARGPHAKEVLNERVKHREAFRPFAPVVLAEHAAQWFDVGDAGVHSPFMLRVCPFLPQRRAEVPAVVHVDGTGRLQTVDADSDPRLRALLTRFHALTGVPLLLNTSFNIAGEPIVETPEDALWCFLSTGLDALVMADMLVTKSPQFRSLLDLSVALCADGVTLDLAVRGPDGTVRGEPRLHVRVNTRWGAGTQSLDAELLAVLSLVDGARTGREILELLARDGDPAESERWLTGQLVRLRRGRVVSLHDKPVDSGTVRRPAPDSLASMPMPAEERR